MSNQIFVNNELVVQENPNLENFSSNNVIDPNVVATSLVSSHSRRLDDYDGLFSSQQIKNKDFSKFKNHVYFDSAIDKVSYAFNEILNFPFDKDESSFNDYKNNLNGYTNYILGNKFPKNNGYLKLRDNGYVKFFNKQGSLFNDHSDNSFGTLNPKTLAGHYSFSFWIKPQNISQNLYANDNKQLETVFKKYDEGTQSGFICYLKKEDTGVDEVVTNLDIYKVSIGFLVRNGNYFRKIETEVFTSTTSVFYNICINITSNNNIEIYINGNKAEDTDESGFLSDLTSFSINFQKSNNCMYIGTDDRDLRIGDETFVGLNADIDEFRYFQTALSQSFIRKYMKRNIFSSSYLSLYLKFNEKSGNYTNSNIIIDHSGNKTHGRLFNNNNIAIDDTNNYFDNESCPMTLEKLEDCPVINASCPDILEARRELILSAQDYDEKNINCIFKLFPKHFFVAAGEEENLPVFANSADFKTESNTLQAVKPANNNFVNILLIWARFFDHLKMNIDAVGSFNSIDYDQINNSHIIGVHLETLCKSYGFKFKEILSTVTKDQLNNYDLLKDDLVLEKSIRDIQNKLWYRILINSQDFLRSKGTHHSVESVFNAVGVNIYDYVDIVEQYSFNNIENIDSNIKNIQKFNVVNFGYKSNIVTSANGDSLFYDNKPVVYKEITGPLSGQSWAAEGYFNFNESIEKHLNTKKISFNHIEKNRTQSLGEEQSLFKLISNDSNIIAHVHFKKHNKDSDFGDIIAYCDNGNGGEEIKINNINLYSCGPFYICLKRKYVDQTLTYDLVFKKLNDNITKESISSISLVKNEVNSLNDFNDHSDIKLVVGATNINGHKQEFFGELINLRFWKDIDLSLEEIYAHSCNVKNIGLDDPEYLNITSLNNKLICNFAPEEITDAHALDNSGEITINDVKIKITQNDKLKINKVIEVLQYYKSIKFDQPNKQNRVNIISFSDDENKELHGNFNEFPSYNVPDNYEHDKENRVSIEMSVVKKLNEDIAKITSDIVSFANLSTINQAIYAKDYYSLKERREKYFNKYSQKDFLNYSSLGNVFKFFDNIMTNLLDDLISFSVVNNGFNLVYESHVLERSKYHYKNGYSSVPKSDREEYYRFSKEMPISYRPKFYDEARKIT